MENLKKYLDGFALPAPYGLRKYLDITEPLGQVGFTIALYFRGGHLPGIQAKVCECIREYIQILGKEARCCLTPSGRIVMAQKNGLPIMDLEKVKKLQERGDFSASYLVCSNAKRDEFGRQPPKCMLRVDLYLKKRVIRYSGRRARPDMPSDIPLDKQVSSIFASFTPSLFLIDEPQISFTDLVLKWCQYLHPVNGTAGWGITRACDVMYAESIRPLIAPDLLRFPGLDMPNPLYSEVFTEHIANINWLTMINNELVERIGGYNKLKGLGKDFFLDDYQHGYIIQAGPIPEIGDSNKDEIPYLYGVLQNLLFPLYPPLECLKYITNVVLPPNAGPDFNPQILGGEPDAKKNLYDFFEQWLHRFDKIWIKKRRNP